MKKDKQQQKETFERHRAWLKQEYTQAQQEKPKNKAKIAELKCRINQYDREEFQFRRECK
jgi:hypothetical protein